MNEINVSIESDTDEKCDDLNTLARAWCTPGQCVAFILLVLALPLMFLNVILSKLQHGQVTRSVLSRDVFGRSEIVYTFRQGVLKQLPILWLVVTGKYTWLGLPRSPVARKTNDSSFPTYGDNAFHASESFIEDYAHLKAGLFSLHSLRSLTGIPSRLEASMNEQVKMKASDRVALILRGAFACFVYRSAEGVKPDQFRLFGVDINNDSMTDAVEKVLTSREDKRTKTTCFVNVNSFNLADENRSLTSYINDADLVFADGSGVRLAARKAGVQLKDNVNGTDLLPVLCKEAISKGKSLFLLGSAPGVAEKTRANLLRKYPGLRIDGVRHGYFDKEQSMDVIEEINASGADVLLVALGSPIQERWLSTYKHFLTVESALAVGGLFDFYSGRIPRSPVWMRELGLEWVWRLMQEPRKKFHRYVIGNPQFLLRCWTQLHPNHEL